MKTLLDSSVAYSFGIKYKEPKSDNIPGTHNKKNLDVSSWAVIFIDI